MFGEGEPSANCRSKPSSSALVAVTFGAVCLAIHLLRRSKRPKAKKLKRAKFVLFGDSITQLSFQEGGWGSRLVSLYQRHADVLNRGYSGYSTRFAIPLLRQRLLPAQTFVDAALVTVFLGTNDAVDEEATVQHVPLEEYERNLETIIKMITEQQVGPHGSGTSRILLLTPPPVDEKCGVWPEQQVPTRRLSVAGQYAERATRTGARLGVPVVDVFAELVSRDGWQDFLCSDGVHLSPAGNEAVFELVTAAIARHFPDVALSVTAAGVTQTQLRLDAPLWRDLDAKNLEKSFA